MYSLTFPISPKISLLCIYLVHIHPLQVEGLIAEQCMVFLIVLLPILTECKQENVPDQGPLSSRESISNDKETVVLTSEEGVISVPPQSPTPAARTVSFLTNHQLELGIRALQAAWLINQEPFFWSMQGSITADSFGHYRLELAIDLTEEEGDQMVHQLAGLGDRAESPPGSEYWERDGDLGPEYDEVVE